MHLPDCLSLFLIFLITATAATPRPHFSNITVDRGTSNITHHHSNTTLPSHFSNTTLTDPTVAFTSIIIQSFTDGGCQHGMEEVYRGYPAPEAQGGQGENKCITLKEDTKCIFSGDMHDAHISLWEFGDCSGNEDQLMNCGFWRWHAPAPRAVSLGSGC